MLLWTTLLLKTLYAAGVLVGEESKFQLVTLHDGLKYIFNLYTQT